jgi:phosphohistidine phosphatase
MRRLLLFRHSKTERLAPSGGTDKPRILTERGRADAALMGAYIAKHSFVPAHALVSPAARTRETWQIAATAFRKMPTVAFEERIYEAETQTLFDLVAETRAETETLMLVGHNPGFHELAVTLLASGNVEMREQLHEGLPTSGLVVIDFAFSDWSQLHPQSGRLERFVTPGALTSGADY